ncbi:MAG TPA: hypothetical protein PLL10_01540 [Elusimicrobiales bacterium]|nr:hypothetical protein [Elusimicrobiales bacterium]
MWGSFTDMAVRYGLPAVILIFWYLHNEQQVRLFKLALAQHKENTDTLAGMIKMMVQQQQQQAEQHFTQTERMLERLEYLGGQVGRVENKMDTNQACPVVRGELNKQ